MNNLIENTLQNFLEAYFSNQKPHILLAYSGGLDSAVLLHALSQLSKTKKIALKAVHVDHQLQSASKDFVKFCQAQCEFYGVQLITREVCLEMDSGQSVEALARDARYRVFRELMQEQMILMTAHHADDQVETFLLQLLRGAGPKGLSAMSEMQDFSKGQFARPLLKLSRQKLENYAQEKQLKYFEDPTNLSERFDRNFLRNTLIPQLVERWPGARQAIFRSVQHIANEHVVLSELLQENLQKIVFENSLNINAWMQLENNIQILLLRQWISTNNFQLPSTKILAEAVRQLQIATQDSSTCIQWADVELRTYAGVAYLNNSVDPVALEKFVDKELQQNESLQFPHNLGNLSFTCAEEQPVCLTIKFREGGEKIRCHDKASRKSLKQLFNEKRVFPWMRSRIPLLFDGSVLVSVGDLWINADWLTQQKTQGFHVSWDNRPQLFSSNSSTQIERAARIM